MEQDYITAPQFTFLWNIHFKRKCFGDARTQMCELGGAGASGSSRRTVLNGEHQQSKSIEDCV